SERGQWNREQQTARREALRAGVKELTAHCGAMLHSMCWLTWLAAERPDRLTQERIDAYDREVHDITPKINASLGSIAALDGDVSSYCKDSVDQLLELDYHIGKASLAIDRDPEGGAQRIAQHHEEMGLLHNKLAGHLGAGLRAYLETGQFGYR